MSRGVRGTPVPIWWPMPSVSSTGMSSHVVGVSAGGAFAQLLALGFPDRVLSLVLISTSPATRGDRSLPSATERFGGFLASAEVDWSDRGSVIEYLVAYVRMLAGGVRPFDEVAWRELVCRDVERARDIAASQNHTMIPEGTFHPSRSRRSRCQRSSST